MGRFGSAQAFSDGWGADATQCRGLVARAAKGQAEGQLGWVPGLGWVRLK